MGNVISLNSDWKFSRGDGDVLMPAERLWVAGDYRFGAPSFQYDDSSWQTVELPHDFVVNGNFICQDPKMTEYPMDNPLLWSGSLPTGTGWYRKRFELPADDQQSVYLLFEGVFRDCQVYLNQCYVGNHRSGYSSFYFNISDLANWGGENLLAVRANASTPEGWFYEGGGIYRNVWLITSPPVHVPPWGVVVRSEVDLQRNRPRAAVHISTTLMNNNRHPVHATLSSRLLNPSQQTVGELTTEITLSPEKPQEEDHTIILDAPVLWSLEQPHLYQVITTLRVDGQPDEDITLTNFGIREFHFDPQHGFFLNGQPLKLKGVCCHQDHAGLGAALPDGIHEYRIKKLKEMGCNAYRTAHHPPSPALLDACDRLGMLVMDENRRFSSAPEDLLELESFVRRDRNHPCIVLWCIGNEETMIQHRPQARRIARTLVKTVHRLDPTRPVTLATTFWNTNSIPMVPLQLDEITTSTEVDVMGFNYNEHLWHAYHDKYPQHPIVISEASSNYRTRGCYRSNDRLCHLAWDDPRSRGPAEKQWAQVAQHDFLSGLFIWTGFDYRGEPLPVGWPGISSNFGVMDTCGFPKDNYYFYKAWWSAEPIVHIFPHWNWPDKLGEPITVSCYSNCDEIELFHNGRSLGRKSMPPHSHVEWENVTYIPGKIEAQGMRDGAVVATCQVETTDAPHAVQLTQDYVEARAGGIAVINAAIVDNAGRVVPTADPMVHFTVEGPARIVGVGNGDPSSHEPDQAPHRRAFHGYCQVIVKIDNLSEPVKISALAEGLSACSTAIEFG